LTPLEGNLHLETISEKGRPLDLPKRLQTKTSPALYKQTGSSLPFPSSKLLHTLFSTHPLRLLLLSHPNQPHKSYLLFTKLTYLAPFLPETRPLTTMEQEKISNPFLLAWLDNEAIPAVRRAMSPDQQQPNQGNIIRALLKLLASEPELYNNRQLYSRVARSLSHSASRVKPIPCAAPHNTAFLPTRDPTDFGKSIESGVDTDAASELDFNIELSGTALRLHDHKRAYRSLIHGWREVRRHYAFSSSETGNDEIVTDDEEVDVSSGFEEELRSEDERIHIPAAPSVDASAIINEAISRFSTKWSHEKLPLLKRDAPAIWHSFKSDFRRSKAEEALLHEATLLSKRLEKLKDGIRTEFIGTKRGSPIRQLCESLQQTIYDHESCMFKSKMLSYPYPPTAIVIRTKRRQKPREALGSDDSISVASESIVDSETEPEADFQDVDELFNQLVNKSGIVQLKSGDDAPDVIDLTLDQTSEEDLADDELELENTPWKRRRKIAKSAESKGRQYDALRKQKEDAERSRLNLTLLDRSTEVINPGKTNDQNFVFIASSLAEKLQKHQLDGVRFLWRAVTEGEDDSNASGGLLAHTMGLGNLMQT
jgi:hypothetical protein